MDDEQFEASLISAAFAVAAQKGWGRVSVAAAAHEAGLPLARARQHFCGAPALLLGFGRLADAHALTGALEEGPVRERLFDVLMRRVDFLQMHRAGVRALLRGLPTDPATAALLSAATARSMAWMLGAAGVNTGGVRGLLATQGLVAVWLYTLRAWDKDDSVDLSATMAALDKALGRAEQAAGWLNRGAGTEPAGPKPFPEAPELPLATPPAVDPDETVL